MRRAIDPWPLQPVTSLIFNNTGGTVGFGAGGPAGPADTGPHSLVSQTLQRHHHSILSGAEVMADPRAVLWVFVITGPLSVLSAGAAEFRREEGMFNTTPVASVSAPSRLVCSSQCTAMQPWLCRGFTYHEDGACEL